MPLACASSSASSTSSAGDGRAVGARCGGQDAGLGLQHRRSTCTAASRRPRTRSTRPPAARPPARRSRRLGRAAPTAPATARGPGSPRPRRRDARAARRRSGHGARSPTGPCCCATCSRAPPPTARRRPRCAPPTPRRSCPAPGRPVAPCTSRSIATTAWSPPRTDAASPHHAARCSCSERGACLRCRVSVVACANSRVCSAKSGVRPCVVANSAASCSCRAVITCRRFDQNRASLGSTPTTSRTGRLPPSSGRSVNRTPSRAVSSASSRVLYRSDAATAARCSGRPSSASHRPSAVCTLFEIATCVCRSGSPARESRCVNATASSPRVSTCCGPPAPIRV